MAAKLSPRNSDVSAFEQRGYYIGKQIGQVCFIHRKIEPSNIVLFQIQINQILGDICISTLC